MIKNMGRNLVIGLLFLSIILSITGNVSLVQAAGDSYRPSEYAEIAAGIAKLPANIYKGRFSEEIKWASRAAHAGIAVHNKPDDRQHHNKFWLFWSLVNLSSLLAERASTLSIFSGANDEDSEDTKIAALEQLENMTNKVVTGALAKSSELATTPEDAGLSEKLSAYLKSSPLLAMARTTILPALESGLAVYCATNNENTPAGKRKRIRAQALCSIVMTLSEYINANPDSLESDMYLAFVFLSVLKACDDFFIYDPVVEQRQQQARVAAEAARVAAQAARRPPRAFLVNVDGENRVAIRRNGAQVLDPMNAACPICHENLGVNPEGDLDKDEREPEHDHIAVFACNHAMCDGCYAGRNIARRNDCPQCRAPRNRARERVVRLRVDGDDVQDADEVDFADDAVPGRGGVAGRDGAHGAFRGLDEMPVVRVRFELGDDDLENDELYEEEDDDEVDEEDGLPPAYRAGAGRFGAGRAPGHEARHDRRHVQPTLPLTLVHRRN